MPVRRNPRKEPALTRGLLDLAARARTLRLARGWTLEEAAERADLDVRHLQILEAGTGNPTALTLLRLARGYSVAVGALFDEGSADPRARSPRKATLGDVLADVPEPDPGRRGPAAPSDETLAARVKALRLAREWSQADLAAEAGLSKGAVQGVEARMKSPTLRTLDALAYAFGTTPYALVAPAPKVAMPRARAGRR